ncbi:hypothetical protein BD626DRAFT_551021 [Schizophyllum amplum]|uniref:Uncharacterized protein n=1 Tax=Schizophyllum amplum TaxID=97359 RepID=A0A550BYI8_9AGAR|nr:hypothetical protein BD626DRAFT_551021 [Auriculariopsis ampla]
MSSRLASFKGPSTPTASPVQAQKRGGGSAPNSPSRPVSNETTYHRQVRAALQELQAVAQTWDELVLMDGLKAVQMLVDSRTELENALASVPGRKPWTHLVGTKIEDMERCIVDLDVLSGKLRKQFSKMNAIVDALEGVLQNAHKIKGWQWVSQEPLWLTWSLEKFVTEIPDLLVVYHRSLDEHADMIWRLRSHSISFEDSRTIVSEWTSQTALEEDGWDARWNDLCAVEVERWGRR